MRSPKGTASTPARSAAEERTTDETRRADSPALRVRANPALEKLPAYVVGRAESGIDLILDFNESLEAPPPLPPESNRYPELHPPLEAELADFLGVDADRVLLSCGADDALLRAVFAVAAPGRRVILPEPCYGMIRRWAHLAGAEVAELPWWQGELPVAEIVELADDSTCLVAVVSPGNPTGVAASREAVATLAAALPEALILVDQAYVDFAAPELDLMPTVLAHPNAVLIRTFSKAWGAAGLRVGFAVGDPRVIDWMRRVGLPFPVSRPAAHAIGAVLAAGPDHRRIARVKDQRQRLHAFFQARGIETWHSEGNFLFARFTAAELVWRGLAALGIAVRRFAGKPKLEGGLRITLPGDEDAYERLEHALATILEPQALLFDMDGVLADVSGSYRAAITATAASFGVAVDDASIQAAKAAGNANNDWVLTHRLIAAAGVDVDLGEVTARFEALYQGSEKTPGLRRHERPLLDRAALADLAARLPLAVVTGRPRADAERFLADHGLTDCFSVVVCMEDGPAKPDPAPVRLALERLGVARAWLVGDTPDDLRAAIAARVLPLAVPAPGEDPHRAGRILSAAGAALVLHTPTQITEVLP